MQYWMLISNQDISQVNRPEKRSKVKLTLVGLKGWGLDRTSLELLDDAGTTKLVDLKDF